MSGSAIREADLRDTSEARRRQRADRLLLALRLLSDGETLQNTARRVGMTSTGLARLMRRAEQ